ncbi:hypothetical protein [Paludibaculum fermentans]|uniref:hypothetical protein n=1 Tax=Paludibaculum fermentans TaxID=1473598 RepID=UPI003EB7FAFA
MKILVLRMTLMAAAAVCCLGQAMVEHAAAAAVGTAGSVGGKAISNGLDKVFGRVAAATKEAEGQPEPDVKVKAKAQAGAKSVDGSAGTSGAAAHARRTRVTRRKTAAADTSEPAAAYASARSYAAAAARVVATPQEFAKLATGAPKSELAERLGTASYKISVPEEGHLTEIYRYANHGVAVGTVRVVDGVVSEVKPAKN